MSSGQGQTPPAIPKDDLVRAANQLLKGLSRLRLATKASASDAFEYWIWSRAIGLARRKGMSVQLRNLDANNRVVLRTSPSKISSGLYSYAEITGSKHSAQLHTGIYVDGFSTAQHEVDVAAVEDRNYHDSVGCSDLRWGVEAKLHANTLSMTIPRAVLGAAYDLWQLPAISSAPNRAPGFALISSAPVSHNGTLLLAYTYPGPDPRVPTAQKVRIGATTHLDAILEAFLDRLNLP